MDPVQQRRLFSFRQQGGSCSRAWAGTGSISILAGPALRIGTVIILDVVHDVRYNCGFVAVPVNRLEAEQPVGCNNYPAGRDILIGCPVSAVPDCFVSRSGFGSQRYRRCRPSRAWGDHR